MTATVPVGWGDSAQLDRRTPAVWLLALLLVVATISVLRLAGGAIVSYPVATIVAAVVWTAYAVPFLLFLRHADLFESEPPVLVAVAFAWGAVVSVAVALDANSALLSLMAKLGGVELSSRWGPAVVAPTVEELLKVLGVVMIVLVARDEVDSTFDGLIYGAIVGLGFQVVEDWVYSLNAVVLTGGVDQVGPVFVMLILRGLISGLWSHAAYTAIAGAGIGYAATRHDRSHARRIAVAVLAFLAAWSLHFLWNSPLIIESLPIEAAILALPLKGLPTVVLVLVLARVERRREATWFAAVVAEEVPRGVIMPGELKVLGSQRAKRRARRAARDRGGPPARRLVGRLQREQVALGMAHCRRVPDEALVEASRAKVHGTHSELARLGIPAAVPEAIGRTVPAGAAGYVALVLSAVSVVFSLLAPVALAVALGVRAGMRRRGLVPTPVRLAVAMAWTATALLGLTILLAILA